MIDDITYYYKSKLPYAYRNSHGLMKYTTQEWLMLNILPSFGLIGNKGCKVERYIKLLGEDIKLSIRSLLLIRKPRF